MRRHGKGRVARRAGLRGRVAVVALAAGVAMPCHASAQVSDSTLAQEGIYDRPFIGSLSATSIGEPRDITTPPTRSRRMRCTARMNVVSLVLV